MASKIEQRPTTETPPQFPINTKEQDQVTTLAKKNIPLLLENPVQERSYTVPSLASFDWDTIFSSKHFPRTLEDGQRLITSAEEKWNHGIQKLLEIPAANRTFENTVMAYHDEMTSFDTAERKVRSPRLIHDETPGKMELLGRCVHLKDQIFSNLPLLSTFISFAERVHSENLLTPLEREYLKSIIHSIKEEHLTPELLDRLKRVKQVVGRWEKISMTYLQGNSESKILSNQKRAFSFLSVNLCMMPLSTSMLYGGVLPWPVRIEAIAEELRRLDPDLLFLQEVYDVQAISELHKRLTPSYAHFYGNIPSGLFGLSHESLIPSSGLAIISKFKLENVCFEPYTTITDDHPSGYDKTRFGFDRNYGILHCDVKNGTETLAHIATTHENPFYVDVREKQTRQIIELFKQEAQKHPEIPLILCGDLNIERGDLKEGGERLIKEHFVDQYVGGEPTWYDFGYHWLNKWHDAPEKFLSPPIPWTVDRSLLWSPWTNKNAFTIAIERIRMHEFEKPELALTDHHGIMTHFSY